MLRWGRAVVAALRGSRGGLGGRPGGSRLSLGRPPPPPPPAPSELERADAVLLRKALEGAFLAWFRNGLLATGIGVIAFVQSDTGRDAAYGFFLLGGLCVSHGGVSYVLSSALLRRPMLLAVPAAAASAALTGLLLLLWAASLSLYVGRLEVEIVPEEPPEK
ncbi:transmembrane protein 160 [Corapipo altera]|uniref:transmembrane protein 160 n=1 Tax=Corapipo altera TaxID=415028 RepID=UPI000FD6A6E6|nr:transmembrane protein 160 [Corapipo altera]